MKCEFCGAEWENGANVCPSCGKEAAEQEAAPVQEAGPVPETEAVSETEAVPETPAETVQAPTEEPAPVKAGMKMTPGKLALVIAAAVVLLAGLVALVVWGTGAAGNGDETTPSALAGEASGTATTPTDSGLDDETHKGTYTADDETAAAARETVVAELGDSKLTNGVLQTYYWMQYYDFLEYYGTSVYNYGLDYTQPLDVQACSAGGTWQQFFLKNALISWQRYQALALTAQENGYTMTQEQQDYLDTIEDQLNSAAEENGYENGLAMLQADMGPGCNIEDYREYLWLSYMGYGYFASECDKIVPTEADIENYFAEHEAEYAQSGLTKETKVVDVRHVLIQPEGAVQNSDGTITATDDQWEACRMEAQALLDGWVESGAAEDTFAQLAIDHSVDGNASEGGLYEDVAKDYMVETFDAWCFDESRQSGDYGLVRTEFGYHLMYFVFSELTWKAQAESDYINDAVSDLLNAVVSRYTMDVDYSAIVLGLPDEMAG